MFGVQRKKKEKKLFFSHFFCSQIIMKFKFFIKKKLRDLHKENLQRPEKWKL
jgi:hypothetical protein